MTAKRTQVGVLAAGLLAMLIAIGCTDSGDLISSGNVVVTYPTSIVNPLANEYQCIRMDYNLLQAKVTDGVCAADSGEDFAGKPCGTDTDCSDVTASCDDTFGMACESGPTQNQPCDAETPCPDDVPCVAQGECASFPGGSFTGQGCVSDLDCTPGSGEKCAGRCSAESTNPLGACITAGDCTTGVCEGAQAVDSTGGDPITLLNVTTAVFFTQTCPACELDFNPPILCDPEDPVQCENRCLTGGELGQQQPPITCEFEMCCEKFELVAPPCDTQEDCQVNRCVDSAVPLGSDFLPEGKYEISNLGISKLLTFATDRVPELTSCDIGGDISDQYDSPLAFEVGPGRSNEVRFVIDLAELENLLGPQGSQRCNDATSNFPAWFSVVSQ